MLNLNELYSHNGLEPTLLPHRIILSNGASRTDNTTFTEKEITDAGFTGPYQKPDFNPETQRLVWNSNTFTYKVITFSLSNNTIPPEHVVPTSFYWQRMREERNLRLSITDWSVLPDIQLTEEKKQSFLTYRQKLRDLPKNIEDIHNFTWPEYPQS
jgi:hypothetical protein